MDTSGGRLDMKKPKVNYFEIKRRMVELVYILRCRPEDVAARNELRILKNECPMAWLEVQ